MHMWMVLSFCAAVVQIFTCLYQIAIKNIFKLQTQIHPYYESLRTTALIQLILLPSPHIHRAPCVLDWLTDQINSLALSILMLNCSPKAPQQVVQNQISCVDSISLQIASNETCANQRYCATASQSVTEGIRNACFEAEAVVIIVSNINTRKWEW